MDSASVEQQQSAPRNVAATRRRICEAESGKTGMCRGDHIKSGTLDVPH